MISQVVNLALRLFRVKMSSLPVGIVKIPQEYEGILGLCLKQ